MTKKDLEPRVERLEHDMAGVRQDAVVARVLASGADRDVSEIRSEFRAQRGVLNALRETQVALRGTQVEQGVQLVELRDTVAEHSRRLDSLERTMSDGFSTLNVGMAQIVALLRPGSE